MYRFRVDGDAEARRARGARARRGFTMAELMVVVMIIGMVVYTVSISVDAILPGERLHSSVRELASTIRTARSEAISRSLPYWIQYDLTENRHRIKTSFRLGGGRVIGAGDYEEDRVFLPWEPLKPGIEFLSISIDGAEYVEGIVEAYFSPLGTASDQVIVLHQPQFEAESSFSIEVLALTGLIRFHDGLYSRDQPDDGDFE